MTQKGVYGCYANYFLIMSALLMTGYELALAFTFLYLSAFTTINLTTSAIYKMIGLMLAILSVALLLPFCFGQEEIVITLDPYNKSVCIINWQSENPLVLMLICIILVVIILYLIACFYFTISVNKHFSKNVIPKAAKNRVAVNTS